MPRTSDGFSAIFAILYFLFIILAIYGYIANIVKLVIEATSGGALDLMLILRIIGVFAAPFGAILGFF